jgi:putative ABC transport system permease protein
MDTEQVLIVPIPAITAQSYSALKTELLKHTEILAVTASLNVPSKRIIIEALQSEDNTKEPSYLRVLVVGFDFPETYGIKLDEGRSFSKNFSTDSSGVYLLNEKAASLFGWKKALNKNLIFASLNKNGPVVGILKDFNFASLHSEIEPLALFLSTNPNYFKFISIRLGKGNKHDQLNTVAKVFKDVLPGIPFEYSFLNQSFDNLYRTEMRLRTIVTIFTFIGTFIACLGLIGLVSISTEQRIKEIGIRKVLGASISNILILISKDFLLLVIISNVIAYPIAYYFTNNWLRDFAYKININVWFFLISGVLSLTIAFLTLSFKAMKAANANPVKSLRYE